MIVNSIYLAYDADPMGELYFENSFKTECIFETIDYVYSFRRSYAVNMYMVPNASLYLCLHPELIADVSEGKRRGG